MGPLELLIVLVLLGLLIGLPAVWIVRRMGSRPCPRCGHRVKKGVLTCQDCGYDFSTVGARG